MADPLSPDAFYESARDFAQTSLQAHNKGEPRRFALDAGTALEHLAKACLGARSPALLTDLNGEANFSSLLRLLGISGSQAAGPLRTIGLWVALECVRALVTSSVSVKDLRTLVEMRNGTVHAAQDDEIEEHLVVAFVQHSDALLDAMGRNRAEFWGGKLEVVDALLADASDQVAHRVEVKLAGARAAFSERYGELSPEVVQAVRRFAESQDYEGNQEPTQCLSCQSPGVATGQHEVDYDEPDWEEAQVVNVRGVVWFKADRFACRICGLRLESAVEMEAAGLASAWRIEDADPRDFEPPFDQDAYDQWRDTQVEQEEWSP